MGKKGGCHAIRPSREGGEPAWLAEWLGGKKVIVKVSVCMTGGVSPYFFSLS